jgi:hypothetical protein
MTLQGSVNYSCRIDLSVDSDIFGDVVPLDIEEEDSTVVGGLAPLKSGSLIVNPVVLVGSVLDRGGWIF